MHTIASPNVSHTQGLAREATEADLQQLKPLAEHMADNYKVGCVLSCLRSSCLVLPLLSVVATQALIRVWSAKWHVHMHVQRSVLWVCALRKC